MPEAKHLATVPHQRFPIHGRKKRGKSQLRLDEARRFVATVLDAGDPLAVAAALLVLTGLRPGEAMALQVRDSDDAGAVLWVEKGKTEAARRAFEVAEELRPYLLALARGRASTEYLFVFEPTRDRATLDLSKRRTDALLRRVRALCDQAAVPRVVSHSMRGLRSTLAVGFGTTSGNGVSGRAGARKLTEEFLSAILGRATHRDFRACSHCTQGMQVGRLQGVGLR